MAEQIIVFKNGERVITELKEVFEGEGDDRRGVCLLMSHPYILELVSADGTSDRHDLQVKFSKWCPYSVDFEFRVPYDTVLAIGEPDQGLAQAYRSKVDVITATNPDQVPEWQEGQDNPNMAQQQADIAAATKGGFTVEGNGAPVDASVPSA